MNPIIADNGRSNSAIRPIQPVVEEEEAEMISDAAKWVLVVDDEPDVLESVADFVAGLPISPRLQVRTARSGPEAIERMARQFFDLIITDFGLGRMDGVTFLEVARQMEPDVPCVLMSGDPAGALERLATLQEENVLFLAKPIDPSALASHSMDALGWHGPVVGRQMVTAAPVSQTSVPRRALVHGHLQPHRGISRRSGSARVS